MAKLADHIRHKAVAAVQILNQHGSVRAAYVFGSQVDGQPDQWSDIDVAAFMDGIETWGIEQRAESMMRVQREVGMDVEAHLFPVSTLHTTDTASFASYMQRHGVCIFNRERPVE